MTSKLLWLFITFSTVSCGSLKVHDTEVCNVAGVLSAGVSCTRAVSGVKTEKTFEELIDMLEPNEERGGAVVIPLNDFVDLKTTLEQACVYVRCKKSVKKKLNNVIQNLNNLIYKTK